MKISLVSVFCFHSFQVGSQVSKMSKDLVFMWFPHFKLALMAHGSHVVKIKNIWFSAGFLFFKLVNGQHAVGNEVMAIKIDLVFIWFSTFLFNLMKRGN